MMCFVGEKRQNSTQIVFTTQWKRLTGMPRHRWKTLTTFYIRYNVADGSDQAEHACKPQINVHSACNVRSFCTCWAIACFTSRQVHLAGWPRTQQSIFDREKFSLLKATRQPLQPVHTGIQWVGHEANHLFLSVAIVKNVWSSVCCTPQYPYTLTVWCLMKHGDSFTLYEVFSCYQVVLLTAQTVVWTIWTVGGGLTFQILYLFTNNGDRKPFHDHVVTVCASCHLEHQWFHNELVLCITLCVVVFCADCCRTMGSAATLVYLFCRYCAANITIRNEVLFM